MYKARYATPAGPRPSTHATTTLLTIRRSAAPQTKSDCRMDEGSDT
jgi:hypothetical protein